MKSMYEEMGGTYHEDEHGCLIPDLKIPEEEMVPVGLWGQRHKRFLKEHKPILYSELLLEGCLNRYLATIDEQAQDRYDLLIDQMKERQGITEQLKMEAPFEWVGRMNNIAACAREIVNTELIYT
ncbi:MAG: TnpV protein [Lachnospiraceae bacterium]|nr:TnpV protein [Lachnospiraceae bacterium]